MLGLGLLAISLAALLPVTVSFAQTVSFGDATNFTNGFDPPVKPESVAIGDLDGDGVPDLAVANAVSNNVSILLNDGSGNGSFDSKYNVAVGTFPVSVAIGDLNGDGAPDLAVANQNSNNVSILLNDDGFFEAFANFAVGTSPVSVAMGDLNGDGKLDLAVANDRSHDVSILLNTFTGAGTFGADAFAATTFRPDPPGNRPTSVAIGDLNGDGKLDLAVANSHSNHVSILLNTGAGSFGAAMKFAVGFLSVSVAIGDLNGDGKPDLAVVNNTGDNNSDGGVSILLNNGAGTFGGATRYAVGSGPKSVAIGDLNGDGKPDLAVAIGTDNVSILVNNGLGAFGRATNFAVGANPRSVAIGDLNGDGKLDLAVANGLSNDFSILLNTTPFDPSGNFGLATRFAVGRNPVSVAVGDLDGDGKPDLAVANVVSDNVSILFNNTNAGAFGRHYRFGVGSAPRSVAIGDLDGDGKPDLAVANQGSDNISILLNTVGSFFREANRLPVGSAPVSVAIGDLNRDGKPDLAVANQGSDNVSILLNIGAGAFGAVTRLAVGSRPRSVAIGDLNGDGKPDLAVANASSYSVSILLGAGAGSFDAATDFPVGSDPVSVAIGDLNRDGKPDGKLDLAVANGRSHDVSILFGNVHDDAFYPAQNFPVGSAPASVAIGDLNRDGKPDLAVANSGSNNVSILFGNVDDYGDAFGAAKNFPVGTFPLSVAIGDLNRDGKPDLAVANLFSDDVSVLLNTRWRKR